MEVIQNYQILLHLQILLIHYQYQLESYYNIREPKGGPHFPIPHTLRFRRVAVALQAHMPAVHSYITITVKNSKLTFLWLTKLYQIIFGK